MIEQQSSAQTKIEAYKAFIENKDFPCVAARAALVKQQLHCMVAGNMACPKDDRTILEFIYNFVNKYRQNPEPFQSVAIIFDGPVIKEEQLFDELLWQRLQALSNLDALQYHYDKRVAADPHSPDFSFSLKEEAFFIIGLHPGSSRVTRRFAFPAVVLNPHAQFEALRNKDQYGKMKAIIRKRDIVFSGSINPMLEDFGTSSEVYQYSGTQYDNQWKCPLKINHGRS